MNDDTVLQKWKVHSAHHQEKLYKNVYIQFLFDMGHKYIATQGRQIQGTILDIGCGMGYHLKFEHISKQRKYICMDMNQDMLDQIKDNRVVKLMGKAEQIPLPDKSVNVVIASHILEHISELNMCLQEIKRVLVDKGTLLVVLPCDPGFLWNTLTLFSPSRSNLKAIGLDYKQVMKYEHVNTFQYCVKELTTLFKMIDMKYFPFFVRTPQLNIMCGMTFKKK